jgi:hypothetical protein
VAATDNVTVDASTPGVRAARKAVSGVVTVTAGAPRDRDAAVMDATGIGVTTIAIVIAITRDGRREIGTSMHVPENPRWAPRRPPREQRSRAPTSRRAASSSVSFQEIAPSAASAVASGPVSGVAAAEVAAADAAAAAGDAKAHRAIPSVV